MVWRFVRRRRVRWVLGLVTAAVLALFVPDCPGRTPKGASAQSFRWDREAVFADLERRYEQARSRGCDGVGHALREAEVAFDECLERLPGSPGPGDRVWDDLEASFHDLAALSGACPSSLGALLERGERLRRIVKERTRFWDLRDRPSRDSLYRLLYGTRAAVEELLLQADPDIVPPVSHGLDEASSSPSTVVRGVRIRSGDLVVSRGGAPTSALIARGSDYPGNFSHVALVHVDPDGTPRVIEAHIEVGVVVSSLDDYLRDRKLRVLVLRLRRDLLGDDPELPHRVASNALEAARTTHIPYDFAMDYRDPRRQFCSEVASHAYGQDGIRLWEGLTKMSEGAVVAWLSGFGVEHFETHGPSDLEYDPKLVVVAEWRNPETLFRDHIDAAVIDALLARAPDDRGLAYDWWLLPAVRIAKAYSAVLNLGGLVGPVPEGMSATTALRVEHLRAMHETVRLGLERRAERFSEERGYRPPYWALVRLAEEVAEDEDMP